VTDEWWKNMSDFSYEILDLLKKYDNRVEAALEGENSPQCLYAFSPLRENLFEWVELEADSRVLQIGSDYGSYTGLFLARAGEVVVLDERDENLEINRIRHGKRKNLHLISGNVTEAAKAAGLADFSKALAGSSAEGEKDGQNCVLEFKAYKPEKESDISAAERMGKPFDYVVMAGSFEAFGKENAAAMLNWAAGFLKPGGMLLAAAENEAGVRYWMGAKAPENGFLEAEYRELFEGLKKQYGGEFTMYYPVPDYRYPSSVYSDQYLPQPGELTNISSRFDGEGLRLGSEEEALTKACRNGIFPQFANSFLGVYRRGQL